MKNLLCIIIFLIFFTLPDIHSADDKTPFLDLTKQIPAGQSMVFVSSDLGSLWKKISSLPVWYRFRKIPQGKALITSVQQSLSGLEMVGMKPEDLFDMFRDEFALLVQGYDLSDPDFLFMISARNRKEYFEDIFNSLIIFATINGISTEGEKYDRFRIQALSTDFYYVLLGPFVLFGNSADMIKECIDLIREPEKSLFSERGFAGLHNNIYHYSDFFIYLKDTSRFPAFNDLQIRDSLISGRLTHKIDLKMTLAAASNSRTIPVLTSNRIDPDGYSFVPKNIYYVRSLSTESPSVPALQFFGTNLLRERLEPRNNSFFRSFVKQAGPNLIQGSQLLICKPYQSSTNYAFVFRLKKGGADPLPSFLSGKDLLATEHRGFRITYFKDPEGSDGFNYYVRVKNHLIAGDALKVVRACLDAFSGYNYIRSSETFMQAYKLTPSNKNIFFVFNMMKWLNIRFEDSDPEYLNAFKDFSAFITVTTLGIRDNEFPGVSILLKSFPVVR